MSSPPSALLHSSNYLKNWYIVGVLTLVYVFNFIDRQIISVLQEPMRADLDLSDTQLGLLQGLTFALFYVTVGIPLARWADVGVRRNVVALAVGTWSVMTALCGVAQNYTQLLFARIGVGIGEAGGSPPSHSIISDLFPPGKRALPLAVYSSGITFGVFIAYVFGAWVSDNFGWRIVFIALGIPGVFLALLVRFTVTEPPRGQYDGIDSDATRPTHPRSDQASLRESHVCTLIGGRFVTCFCKLWRCGVFGLSLCA